MPTQTANKGAYQYIHQNTEDLRQAITQHGIYGKIDTIDSLQIFMEAHVYAVWDFMSIVKKIQQYFTSWNFPWRPPHEPQMARFINEVVLEEETDHMPDGRVASHFSMYIQAMEEVGANTRPIEKFMELMQDGYSWNKWSGLSLDEEIKLFVDFNLKFVDSDAVNELIVLFAVARENLIPDMFGEMINKIDNSSKKCKLFLYYLNRHIELDGGEHGIAAKRMVAYAAHNRSENELLEVARDGLELRFDLLSAIEQKIDKSRA